MGLQLEVVNSLAQVDASAWNQLAGQQPFVQHGFLHLLHSSGCASPATGWHPHYLLLRDGDTLVGAAAAYLKTHSRGEFVFDQAWANAYQQHGLAYYPKLVVAVPFTPVTGPRLLAHTPAHQTLLAQGLQALAQQTQASSVHVLFPHGADTAVLQQQGYALRDGVQFHWRNAGYASFDAFLATLSQEKRKKLKQDSKKVAAAGVRLRWLEGEAITPEALAFFYSCYQSTYDKHWGRPYLTPDFFTQLHAQDPRCLLLVLAERDGQPLACALNVKSHDTLFGRYWGSTEFVPGLHFEACYAQAIAYCIAHGLQVFEGGAQGEHKMARGLLPVKTQSAHWIADPRFAQAIADFLARETQAIAGYVEELEHSSPFKPPATNPAPRTTP